MNDQYTFTLKLTDSQISIIKRGIAERIAAHQREGGAWGSGMAKTLSRILDEIERQEQPQRVEAEKKRKEHRRRMRESAKWAA